jgi:hypothetical protein
MDKRLAERTNVLMLRVTADLDAHLSEMKAQCSEEEFARIRRGFGYVPGYMLTDIMMPIYSEHPDLKPKHLGGPYEINSAPPASQSN